MLSDCSLLCCLVASLNVHRHASLHSHIGWGVGCMYGACCCLMSLFFQDRGDDKKRMVSVGVGVLGSDTGQLHTRGGVGE